MKFRILVLVCMLVSMSVQGRVAYPIVKVGLGASEVENGMIWDFDRQSVLDEHGKSWCRQDSNLIFEAFGDCVRAYSIAGDAVFYRGYNIGRSERMLIDSTLIASVEPTAENEKHEGSYTAHGLLFRDLSLEETGTYVSENLGTGKVVFNGDTLKNILLRKEEFNSKKTLGSEKYDSCHAVLYKWYEIGHTLPIAAQIDNCRDDRVANSSLFLQQTQIEISPEKDNTEEEILAFLQSAQAKVTPTGVDVSFDASLIGTHTIELHLLDVSGNIFSRISYPYTEDATAATLPTQGARPGQYIVAICLADYPELNHKLMVTL